MGINPDKFSKIWRAVDQRRKNLGISLSQLSIATGYSEYRLLNGINYGNEWITSDLVHDCVDRFGLRSSRQRNIEEDSAYDLPDEECVRLLTQILEEHRQTRLFD